jgi:hypothetical protein
MEPNQFCMLGAKSSAKLVSGNFSNEADGFIWPTEGLFFTPAGLRYDLLEVI